MRLLQKGDNRAALAKFNEAFALVQSPKIMFNMGKAYRALGNDVEALRAFDTFLDEAPYAPKASRADAEREVQALRPKLSYIEVETEDTGSTVRIDGREMGKAPLVRPVVVAPGSHEVKVEKTGMVAETRSVAPIAGPEAARGGQAVAGSAPSPENAETRSGRGDAAAAGERRRPARRRASRDTDKPDVTEPIERPPGHIDGPPVETPPSGHPWQYTAAWVSVGIGALALGGGITAQVLWSQKNDEFNSVKDRGRIPVDSCAPPASLRILAAGPAWACTRPQITRLTLAIAGYATAGAAAIGALVFYLTAPSSTEGHVQPQFRVAGLLAGGIVVVGPVLRADHAILSCCGARRAMTRAARKLERGAP